MIPITQPLQAMYIPESLAYEITPELLEEVKAELNIKEIKLKNFSHLLRVKPNWRRIGPRFKDQTGAVVASMNQKSWDMDEVVSKVFSEPDALFEITVGEEGIVLSYQDIVLEQVPHLPPNINLLPGFGMVALDTTVSARLGREGLYSLFLQKIQYLRKMYDNPEGRMVVVWAGTPEVQRMVQESGQRIKDVANVELEMVRYMLDADYTCDWFDLQITL